MLLDGCRLEIATFLNILEQQVREVHARKSGLGRRWGWRAKHRHFYVFVLVEVDPRCGLAVVEDVVIFIVRICLGDHPGGRRLIVGKLASRASVAIALLEGIAPSPVIIVVVIIVEIVVVDWSSSRAFVVAVVVGLSPATRSVIAVVTARSPVVRSLRSYRLGFLAVILSSVPRVLQVGDLFLQFDDLLFRILKLRNHIESQILAKLQL